MQGRSPPGMTILRSLFGHWGGGSSAKSPPDPTELRRRMVTEQLIERGIENRAVLEAMVEVPRHEFVPSGQRAHAYDDCPLPIGCGQTISQPYIVAFMTEALELEPSHRVLEIGTGSGYQTAVLSRLVREVYTVEIIAALAQPAALLLERLGYTNIQVRTGDGYAGWPEAAPFDRLIVTCAPDHVPPPLIEQLKEGGRMMIPVGPPENQHLHLLEKVDGRLFETEVLSVRFVPMTGTAEQPPGA